MKIFSLKTESMRVEISMRDDLTLYKNYLFQAKYIITENRENCETEKLINVYLYKNFYVAKLSIQENFKNLTDYKNRKEKIKFLPLSELWIKHNFFYN